MSALHSPWGFIRTLVWDRRAFACLCASLLNVEIKMQVSKECFIPVYLPVCLDRVSTNHSINFLHLSVLQSAHLLSWLSSNKNNVLHLKWIHLHSGLVSVAFPLWFGLLVVLLLHSVDFFNPRSAMVHLHKCCQNTCVLFKVNVWVAVWKMTAILWVTVWKWLPFWMNKLLRVRMFHEKGMSWNAVLTFYPRCFHYFHDEGTLNYMNGSFLFPPIVSISPFPPLVNRKQPRSRNWETFWFMTNI